MPQMAHFADFIFRWGYNGLFRTFLFFIMLQISHFSRFHFSMESSRLGSAVSCREVIKNRIHLIISMRFLYLIRDNAVLEVTYAKNTSQTTVDNIFHLRCRRPTN